MIFCGTQRIEYTILFLPSTGKSPEVSVQLSHTFHISYHSSHLCDYHLSKAVSFHYILQLKIIDILNSWRCISLQKRIVLPFLNSTLRFLKLNPAWCLCVLLGVTSYHCKNNPSERISKQLAPTNYTMVSPGSLSSFRRQNAHINNQIKIKWDLISQIDSLKYPTGISVSDHEGYKEIQTRTFPLND